MLKHLISAVILALKVDCGSSSKVKGELDQYIQDNTPSKKNLPLLAYTSVLCSIQNCVLMGLCFLIFDLCSATMLMAYF
jgi:hypothetical protein